MSIGKSHNDQNQFPHLAFIMIEITKDMTNCLLDTSFSQ